MLSDVGLLSSIDERESLLVMSDWLLMIIGGHLLISDCVIVTSDPVLGSSGGWWLPSRFGCEITPNLGMEIVKSHPIWVWFGCEITPNLGMEIVKSHPIWVWKLSPHQMSQYDLSHRGQLSYDNNVGITSYDIYITKSLSLWRPDNKW